MIAAAVMREWNPLQVVPVVPDAWIRLRFHTVEIASVDETFPDTPLREDLVRAQQRITSVKFIPESAWPS